MNRISELFLNDLVATRDIVKPSGVDWYGVRCPFCGDSQNNPNAFHLYLRIPSSTEDDLYAMRCFKPSCNVSRVMTQQDLLKLGVRNREVSEAIGKYQVYNKVKDTELMNFRSNIIIPKGEVGVDTKAYFKERTGYDLTEELIIKLRIIPDIRKFLKENKDVIQTLSDVRLQNMYNKPDNHIGFMNDTGTRIEVRYHGKHGRSRNHDKIPLIKLDKFQEHKAYVIEEDVAEYNTSGLAVVVGEGLFDTINSYLHLDIKKGLFIETGGFSSFTSTILSYTRKYYDIDWYILKDSDIGDWYFDWLLKNYGYRFKNGIYIVSSKNTKDIGDMSKNPIIQISERK